MKLRPKEFLKRLMVKFRGEEGLDYGGPARYFSILSYSGFVKSVIPSLLTKLLYSFEIRTGDIDGAI